LVVADFDLGIKPNNVGGDWGAWNFDPEDREQGTEDSIEADDYKNPSSGRCLRIDYDVQSPNPAFNGLWMKLGGLDATPYSWLSFYVRGPSDGKFTKRFKVELKNETGERAPYLVDGVSTEWKEIRIPFKAEPSFEDWSRLTEFVIVFDDILATYKEGTIYLDQIEFQK